MRTNAAKIFLTLIIPILIFLSWLSWTAVDPAEGSTYWFAGFSFTTGLLSLAAIGGWCEKCLECY